MSTEQTSGLPFALAGSLGGEAYSAEPSCGYSSMPAIQHLAPNGPITRAHVLGIRNQFQVNEFQSNPGGQSWTELVQGNSGPNSRGLGG